jgi:hypothetical protein
VTARKEIGRANSSPEWSEAGALSGPDHGNVVVSEDQTPPDPRLIELTRIMARLAARAWYASQRRG